MEDVRARQQGRALVAEHPEERLVAGQEVGRRRRGQERRVIALDRRVVSPSPGEQLDRREERQREREGERQARLPPDPLEQRVESQSSENGDRERNDEHEPQELRVVDARHQPHEVVERRHLIGDERCEEPEAREDPAPPIARAEGEAEQGQPEHQAPGEHSRQLLVVQVVPRRPDVGALLGVTEAIGGDGEPGGRARVDFADELRRRGDPSAHAHA